MQINRSAAYIQKKLSVVSLLACLDLGLGLGLSVTGLGGCGAPMDSTPGLPKMPELPSLDEDELTPVIERIEPALSLNRGGGKISIIGRGFAAGATVEFGLQARPNFVVQSGTLITGTIPAAPPGTHGPVTVMVRNPNGKYYERTNLFRYYLTPFPFRSALLDLGSGTAAADVITLAADDLNQDGQPDVAAASKHGVTMFLSNFWGSFDRSQVYITQQGIQSVLIGDENLDGHPDVATKDMYGATMVLEGDGQGRFTPAKAVASLPANFQSRQIADFNRDGEGDAASVRAKEVTGDYYNDVGLLFSQRDDDRYGFYCSELDWSAANRRAVTVADLNRDGKLDIIASRSSESNVAYSTILGDGTGGFAAPQGVALGAVPTTTHGSSFVVADWNGDLYPDLAFTVVTSTGTSLGIMLGDGLGGFASPRYIPHPSQYGQVGLAAADFNGDQKMDLATSRCGTNDSLNIFTGDGKGGFAETFQASPGGCAITVADFNGDQKPDVVLGATQALRGVRLYLNDGLGGFRRIQRLDLDVVPEPNALAVGDFNGDDLPDLAVMTWNREGFLILGSKQEGLAAPKSLGTHASNSDLVVADWNLDQRLDLVLLASNGGGLTTVLFGDGSGGFLGRVLYERKILGAGVSADLNGDGRPDLVTCQFIGGNVRWNSAQ